MITIKTCEKILAWYADRLMHEDTVEAITNRGTYGSRLETWMQLGFMRSIAFDYVCGTTGAKPGQTKARMIDRDPENLEAIRQFCQRWLDRWQADQAPTQSR